VPSLFRRKPSDPATEAPDDAPDGEAVEAPPRSTRPYSRGYTPAKGKATPKRPSAQVRRAEPAPANRKEAAKRIRDRQRTERAEQRAAMMAGDERYLLPRDKGPERALARDVVDSRRTVGSWFFAGALIVLIGSGVRVPAVVLVSNLLWVVLALAVVADSVLISRKVGRLVRKRYPKSTVKPTSLYLYASMRGLTFRGMRIPKPRVKVGEKI
jgi:Protein of unknown function (DUF3043)